MGSYDQDQEVGVREKGRYEGKKWSEEEGIQHVERENQVTLSIKKVERGGGKNSQQEGGEELQEIFQ